MLTHIPFTRSVLTMSLLRVGGAMKAFDSSPALVASLAVCGLMLWAAPARGARLAGGSYHSIAVRADGTAWSWGHNTQRQLG